ncbi:unnamed protein product, partial [Ectocarpus sp. 12 AP-2014]
MMVISHTTAKGQRTAWDFVTTLEVTTECSVRPWHTSSPR